MLMVLTQRLAFVSGNRSEGYGHPDRPTLPPFPVAQIDRAVPWAASFAPKMLRRPTLDFSARRHSGPDPALKCVRLPDRMGGRRTTAADNARLRRREVPMRFIAFSDLLHERDRVLTSSVGTNSGTPEPTM